MPYSRRSYLKGTTATAIAGLAGCSGFSGNNTGGGSTSGGTSLVRLGVGNIPGSGAQRQFIDNTTKLVNEKTGDGIKFEMYEITGQTGQMTQKLKTKLTSKNGDPDIFNLDSIYVQQFAAAGWLLPFHKHVSSSEMDRFADSGARSGQWNGKLYAAPQYLSCGHLYWNKSLFKEAGLDPETPPKTTKELVSMAQTVLQETNVENAFTWQGKQYEGLTCDWLEYVHEKGGWIFGGAENLHKTPGERPITIDSKEVIQATRDMQEFIYKDNISPKTVTSMTEGTSMRVFQQGNAVFHRNWVIPPSLEDSKKSEIVGKWGMSSMVGGHGTLGNENYGMNAYTDNPKATAEVTKLLAFDKDIQLEKMKVGNFPAVKKYLSDSDFADIKPMGKYMNTLSESLANSIERPSSPIYQQESQQVFQKYVSGVINKNYSAEEGMSQAAADLKEMENDYEGP